MSGSGPAINPNLKIPSLPAGGRPFLCLPMDHSALDTGIFISRRCAHLGHPFERPNWKEGLTPAHLCGNAGQHTRGAVAGGLFTEPQTAAALPLC